MRIIPDLKLLCKRCGWRPHETQTMMEVREHMVKEHQTEEVDLDLAAICSCGTEMRHLFIEPVDGVFRDHYKCSKCGNEGFIERTK